MALVTVLLRIGCKKRLHIAFIAVLAAGFLLRLGYAAHLPLSNDEGSYLYDGLLLSQGKWPFLTSFSRAPVLMFLTSIVVKIFGRSFLAGRMISILAGLGSACFLYLIGRKLFNKKVGLFAFLLYALISPSVVHTIYLHTQPLELFFVLAGVWFVLRGTGKIDELREFIFAGIFFGLAALVREVAVLYPLAMVFVILLLSPENFWGRLKNAFVVGISALVVWGSVWGLIISQVGFERIRAVFLAIMTMHKTGEYMSFGFTLRKKFEVFYAALPENFILYILTAIFAIILASKIKEWVRRKKIEKSWFFLLVLCVVPFLFYGIYYRRMQAEYLSEFMPALVLMGAVALGTVKWSVKKAVAVLILSTPLLLFNFKYQWDHQHGGTHAPEALAEVISYLEENVPADEEIFTAAVIIPFSSGHPLSFDMSRPVIFGYPHLDPRIKYTLFLTDQEIVDYLENRPVRWAIFDRTTWETFSRGHPEIENYLKKNYNIVKEIPNERTGTVLEIAVRF